MFMKKYFRYYFICWLFIFVTFNVVAFVFPFPRDETGTLTNNFWISYFFYTVVLLGLLLSSWMLFKDENKFKLFLGIPLVSISFGVLFVTTVICVFLFAVPQIPIWIGIIASFAVLCFYAVSILNLVAGTSYIADDNNKIKNNTFFIRSLSLDAEHLVKIEKDDEKRKILKMVADKVRYSDPMSSDNISIQTLEKQIYDCYCKVENSTDKDLQLLKSIAEEMLSLLDKRNRQILLLKQ